MLGRAFGVGGCLVVLLVAACGGSAEHTGSTPPAELKCNALLNQYCDSSTACLVSGGLATEADRGTTTQSCVTEAAKDLPCDHAVSVADSYEQCIADLKALPCDAIIALAGGAQLNPLPVTCRGVIGILR